MIKFVSSTTEHGIHRSEMRGKRQRHVSSLWAPLPFFFFTLFWSRGGVVHRQAQNAFFGNNNSQQIYHETLEYYSHQETSRLYIPNDTKNIAAPNHTHSILQLKVPFYVYTNELDWSDLAFLQNGFMESYRGGKHSDDFWFLVNALKHPMRTTNPNKAKLFFVPTLLNLASRAGKLNYLFKEVCKRKEISPCFKERSQAYHFVDRALAKSPYFKRSKGKDHVIVTSHWTFRPDRWCNIEGPKNWTHSNILKCNLVNFEGYISGKNAASPSMYIGRPCDLEAKKTFDFSMTASLHAEKPVFQTRRDICQWLHEGNYSVAQCGEGPQCPSLSRSKYGFHARGDTWGANRVMDTLRSRTIPLFTDEEQYNILPSFIPWREISYLVNVTTQESFEESLQDILSRPPSEYLEMQRLIGQYVHIFDHKTVYQFDAYMADFAARLGFQNESVQEISWILDDYLDAMTIS
jgi:Exostosin family